MIKISSGRLKGLGLKAPEGRNTRPTSAARREALFNIVCNGLGREPRLVLDLFAGSGALGIEAFSWGASKVVFVESDSKALASLRDNIERVAASSSEMAVVPSGRFHDWSEKLAKLSSFIPFDLVICDPPYEKGLGVKALEALERSSTTLFDPEALLILECSKKEAIPDLKGWNFLKTRVHGAGQLCLYERGSPSQDIS